MLLLLLLILVKFRLPEHNVLSNHFCVSFIDCDRLVFHKNVLGEDLGDFRCHLCFIVDFEADEYARCSDQGRRVEQEVLMECVCVERDLQCLFDEFVKLGLVILFILLEEREELFDVREGEVELEVVLENSKHVKFQRNCLAMDLI